MAKYSLLLQQPDAPLTERWLWQSDAIMADDGTEQTISLASTPKRSFLGTFVFDSEASIRRHQASMFGMFAAPFLWPAWHDIVVLKAPCGAAATALPCNTRRSDFRVGAPVLIVEGDKFVQRTVDAVTDAGIVVTPALGTVFSRRARIVPILLVYIGDNAPFIRTAGNKGATATFNHLEYTPPSPFILDAHKKQLTLFNGLPVLEQRGIGVSFEDALVTGIEITDYGAQAALRSRWKNGYWQGKRDFNVQRMLDPEAWHWWRTFADACRGGAHLFYLPTWRPDFGIHTPAQGNAFVALGHEYRDHYWPTPSFRAIMIEAPDRRRHYAAITQVVDAGANDQVIFDPPLPAGDWSGHQISLLLKSRIADDTMTITHSGVESLVTINVRTTD